MTLTELVSAEVFKLLQPKLPEGSKQRSIQLTKRDESDIKEHVMKDPRSLVHLLVDIIGRTYDELPYKLYGDVAKKTTKSLCFALSKRNTSVRLPMELSDTLLRRLEWAFTEMEYRGTAPDRFRAYVERCWTDYRLHPDDYEAPCVAITQSSGFGKSRLLLELTRATSSEEGGSVGVLYTCSRLEESTGYPKATPKLKEWLFERDLLECTSVDQLEDRLADHLVAIYIYAQKHWNIGRNKWLELFQQPQPLDKHLAARLEKLERRLRRNPQEWTTKLGKLTKDAAASKRLVILAVDEAATLISSRTDGLNPLRLLQRALVKANYRIASVDTRAKGFAGGIPEVYKLGRVVHKGNALLRDSSSRYSSVGPQSLFPPFVLSDVLWKEGNIATNTTTAGDEIAAYKSVLFQSEIERMKHLVTMGRPMWAGIFDSNERGNGTGDVLRLAARKLLVGCDPDNVNSYNEATMFGVASLLCRLGVRPRSSSPLASRAVNKFMAVLAHVNCANEGYVSIYASDPVLSLGAAYVWHAHNSVLRRFILPQLKKLLLNEEVDAGGILETVVARVVLLLAVDWCVLEEENKGIIAATKAGAKFQLNYRTFRGQFVNVRLFMETLESAKNGVDIPVKENGTTLAKEKTRKQYKKWRSQWNDWQLGFSHFVTLELEPSEHTLCFLLGRYAAGIFTHNQNGVYVVIPIFRKSQIGVDASPKTAESEPDDENAMEMSMVLIRVEDSSHRGGYDAAKLLPVNVFSPVNPLHWKSCSQVIRVCMRLQEEEVSEEFVYVEHVECDHPTHSSEGLVECSGTRQASSLSCAFTYCICPISNPKIVDADTGRQLMDLMSSFGHPMDLVEGDLSLRREFVGRVRRERRMPPLSKLAGDAELRTCASLALVRAPGPIQEEQRIAKRSAPELPPFDAKTRPKKKKKSKTK